MQTIECKPALTIATINLQAALECSKASAGYAESLLTGRLGPDEAMFALDRIHKNADEIHRLITEALTSKEAEL